MEKHTVKIVKKEALTHDVRLFRVEKPEGYSFIPGQATEVSINQEGWDTELRPFTFTSLNEEPYLEFNIKIYSDHDGVTKHLDTLKEGDELIIHDVWGAIKYDGKGTFIAGGAGITPFIAILRQLEKDNKVEGNQLLFANKTVEDIIRKDDLESILGENFHNILSQENHPAYAHGFIDKEYLKNNISDFNQKFYICGPKPMVKAMQTYLQELGAADSVLVVEV